MTTKAIPGAVKNKLLPRAICSDPRRHRSWQCRLFGYHTYTDSGYAIRNPGDEFRGPAEFGLR